VTAGLECHVERGADRILLARFERRDFGVRRAIGGVIPLTQDLSIANDDGADEWIGARVPPAMRGQLDCPPDVLKIVVGQKAVSPQANDLLSNRRPERR
jgi:hypothetical protein